MSKQGDWWSVEFKCYCGAVRVFEFRAASELAALHDVTMATEILLEQGFAIMSISITR